MNFNKNRQLPHPNELPHISRQEFCDRMDDVLEDVEKNRTAYVLTENGKDDLFVCPAEWFYLTFDDDFGLIVSAAVRYSIGRHTYMPEVVSAFIKKYQSALSSKTLENVRTDIEEAIRQKNPVQNIVWTDLLETVERELQRRKETE